jgi:hypothetical protein
MNRRTFVKGALLSIGGTLTLTHTSVTGNTLDDIFP